MNKNAFSGYYYTKPTMSIGKVKKWEQKMNTENEHKK